MAKRKVQIDLTGSADGLQATLQKANSEIKGFARDAQKHLDNVKPKSFMDTLAMSAKAARKEARSSGEMALERVAGGGIGGMAQFGLRAAGFGMAGLAADMAGETLAKTGEMLVKIKEGANPAEMVVEWGKGLPILGGWVKAAESFHELMTGSRAEAERLKKALEAGEKIDKLNRQATTELSGHFDPVVHGGLVAEEKMNARMKEARQMMREFGPTLDNGKDNPNANSKLFMQGHRLAGLASKIGHLDMQDAIRQSQREMAQADLSNRQNLIGQQINLEKLGAKTSGQIWKAQSDGIIHQYNAKYETLQNQAKDLHTQANDLDKEINDAYGGYREDQLDHIRERRDELLKQEKQVREQMKGVGKESDAARAKAKDDFIEATVANREQIRGGLLGASSSMLGQVAGFANSPELQRTQKLLGAWQFNFATGGQIDQFLKNPAITARQKTAAENLKGGLGGLTELMTSDKFLRGTEPWTPLRFAAAAEGGGSRFSGAASLALEQEPADAAKQQSQYAEEANRLLKIIADNTGGMMGVGEALNLQ